MAHVLHMSHSVRISSHSVTAAKYSNSNGLPIGTRCAYCHRQNPNPDG